jgi:hypothetical protein
MAAPIKSPERSKRWLSSGQSRPAPAESYVRNLRTNLGGFQ